jgi:hypothetical protein
MALQVMLGPGVASEEDLRQLLLHERRQSHTHAGTSTGSAGSVQWHVPRAQRTHPRPNRTAVGAAAPPALLELLHAEPDLDAFSVEVPPGLHVPQRESPSPVRPQPLPPEAGDGGLSTENSGLEALEAACDGSAHLGPHQQAAGRALHRTAREAHMAAGAASLTPTPAITERAQSADRPPAAPAQAPGATLQREHGPPPQHASAQRQQQQQRPPTQDAQLPQRGWRGAPGPQHAATDRRRGGLQHGMSGRDGAQQPSPAQAEALDRQRALTRAICAATQWQQARAVLLQHEQTLNRKHVTALLNKLALLEGDGRALPLHERQEYHELVHVAVRREAPRWGQGCCGYDKTYRHSRALGHGPGAAADQCC